MPRELDHFPLLPGTVVGKTSAASDAAVSSFLTQFLESENQGTLWSIVKGRQSTIGRGSASGEFGSGSTEIDHE